MRRIGSAILAAVVLAAAAVSPAMAAQTQMNVYVVAYHFNLQQDLFAERGAPCSGTECSVTIAVSSRDYGMVKKFCGSTTNTFRIQYPASASSMDCLGANNWKIGILADLRDANGDFSQAETFVDITVTVVKGGTSQL